MSSKPVKKSGKQQLAKVVNHVQNKVDNKIDKINVCEALKLRLVNKLSFQDIATKYHVSRQAVQQRLSTFVHCINDPHVTQAYEDNKAEILSNTEMILLKNLLDSDKIKNASLNNVAYAFTQIHTANRLQRNQATSITDSIDSMLHRLDDRFRHNTVDVTPCNTQD